MNSADRFIRMYDKNILNSENEMTRKNRWFFITIIVRQIHICPSYIIICLKNVLFNIIHEIQNVCAYPLYSRTMSVRRTTSSSTIITLSTLFLLYYLLFYYLLLIAMTIISYKRTTWAYVCNKKNTFSTRDYMYNGRCITVVVYILTKFKS